MNKILVGNSGCPFWEIADVLSEDPFGVPLDRDWEILASGLETPTHKISWLMNKRKDGIGLNGLLIKLLEEWRARKKSEATMAALLNILDNCQFEEQFKIGDHFWKHFHQIIQEDTKWEDLDERTQTKIRERNVQLPSTKIKLEQLYQPADFNSLDSQTIKELVHNEAFQINVTTTKMSCRPTHNVIYERIAICVLLYFLYTKKG